MPRDELEMAVIGGILLEDVETREKAFAGLTHKCFTDPELGRAFQNMRRQFRETGECDAISASEGLADPGVLKECMDMAAIRGVLPYQAGKLFQRYRRQVLFSQVSEVTGGIAFEEPLDELLKKLSRALETQSKLDEIQDSGTSLDFTDSIVEYLNSLYLREEKPVKTGCGLLDYLLGGFRRKSVNVIAGRSGNGKTDIAIYLAVKLAARGVRVLYLTMEMPRTQLMERIASNLTGIDSAELAGRDKQDTPEYQERCERITLALDRIHELPIVFDEEQNLTPEEIGRKVRRHRPDVLFIDHLGLMRRDARKPPWQNAFDNSQELKKLAMRENVILVELVQQNSEAEKKGRKSAVLSDLKGTDGIGNDADTVMFISAEKPEDWLSGDASVEASLEITKNRNGKTGTVPFRWQPQYHRYTPVDRRQEP